ncbi:MAG: TasA family protein [Patescibacteria group bacterium]|nr:TasA family protein [Patescibacteria group bacterium]
MKKIVKSLSIITAVAAIVIGGTVAYFSDTETSVGNTFTAGTIDIDIDGENPWTSNYNIGDLKPGEVGYINFRINNVGENPVDVSKRLYGFSSTDITDDSNVTGYDCSQLDSNWNYTASSEPECVKENGSQVNNVESQILYDLSVEVYNGTDPDPIFWQAIYEAEASETLDAIYDDGNNSVALGMIPVGGHMLVTQSYHFDYNAGNEYQGDGMMFNMEIYGKQLTGADGYASVDLENKSGAPDWDVILGDGIEGTLNYKTQGPEFDFRFTGKVRTAGEYHLLYVGPSNDYPCTDSVVLGTSNFTTTTPSTITGQVKTGTITNGKIWLIPTSSYSGSVMGSWPEADILFETGLIWYNETGL